MNHLSRTITTARAIANRMSDMQAEMDALSGIPTAQEDMSQHLINMQNDMDDLSSAPEAPRAVAFGIIAGGVKFPSKVTPKETDVSAEVTGTFRFKPKAHVDMNVSVIRRQIDDLVIAAAQLGIELKPTDLSITTQNNTNVQLRRRA